MFTLRLLLFHTDSGNLCVFPGATEQVRTRPVKVIQTIAVISPTETKTATLCSAISCKVLHALKSVGTSNLRTQAAAARLTWTSMGHRRRRKREGNIIELAFEK